MKIIFCAGLGGALLWLSSFHAGADEWLYQDALATGWQNWSWSSTLQFSNPAPVYTGAYSLAVTLAGWGALSLHHTALACADYDGLEYFVRLANQPPAVFVQLQNDAAGTASGLVALHEAASLPDGPLSSNVWRRGYIPMSAFPDAPGSFTRVNFYNNAGTAQPAFYLDAIRLTEAIPQPPGLLRAHANGALRVLALFNQPLQTASLASATWRITNALDPAYAAGAAAAYLAYLPAAHAVMLEVPATFTTSGIYQLCVSGVVAAASGLRATNSTATFALQAQAVVLQASQITHGISRFIYGVSFAPDEAYLRRAGMTLNRWGGNRSSRYNWTIGADNSANDWYFENGDWDRPDGSGSAPAFAQRNARGGAASLLTVPMLPWVARDKSAHGFSIAKYGAQDDTDPWRPDAGNGVHGGAEITGNDPADTSVPARAYPGASDPAPCVYQDAWLRSLASYFGAFAPDLIPFLAMDNESDIWNSTHRDVHPAATTYEELANVFLNYANMACSNFPGARITGPVSTGWWYYWNSAAGWDDKEAHGNQDFLPWFLDHVRAADILQGRRSLDVLDIHYYPNMATTGTVEQIMAARLRLVRSFWDPTYRDEGWIGTDEWATQTQSNRNCVALLPRFQELLATHYPGTLLGLTEWNVHGGESDISGALATADALGVFGRERLYLAAYWAHPATNSSVYQAFALYGGPEDGSGGFAPLAVPAPAADPRELGSYASRSADGRRLAWMAVNKNATRDLLVTVDLSAFGSQTTATVRQIIRDAPSQILTLPPMPASNAICTLALPAYSATLFIFDGPAFSQDADGDRLPDIWERAFTNRTDSRCLAGLDPSAYDDPAADYDQDGITNIQEFQGGSDPTDPASAFRLRMQIQGTNLMVLATGAPRNACLAGASRLDASTTWTPVTATGSIFHASALGAATQVFFRIREP